MSPLAEILCVCCKCNLSYVYYITMLKLFQSLLKLAHPLLGYVPGIFVVPTPPSLAGHDNKRTVVHRPEGRPLGCPHISARSSRLDATESEDLPATHREAGPEEFTASVGQLKRRWQRRAGRCGFNLSPVVRVWRVNRARCVQISSLDLKPVLLNSRWLGVEVQ